MEMLELVRQQIQMNRWKNQVGTQVTLDDDFIIPDTMSDADQMILSAGEIQLEPLKIQDGRVLVRGKLDFHVLYRREEGGMQTLGGSIPFEEPVNVPDVNAQDDVSAGGYLEDLNAELIHSRKFGIRAVVRLEIKAEMRMDTEVTVDVADRENEESDDPPKLLMQHRKLEVAGLVLHRKDTWRMKEELTLSPSKPAIGRMLWTQVALGNMQVRPEDGRAHLEGVLNVFVIYEGESGEETISWMEESIPFSGDLEMPGCRPDLILAVSQKLIHRGVEEKPDYDGEMRQIEVDAIAELDVRLYEEKELELLADLYSTNREVTLEIGKACFDQILTHNAGKCRVAEKLDLGKIGKVLQICHSSGSVKLDAVEPGEEVLSIDGALEVQLLCLTDEDDQPIQSVTELFPFHYDASAPGIHPDSIWYLDSNTEQLTAVMNGGNLAEIKAVVNLDVLILQPVTCPVIERVQVEEADRKKMRELPGIVGYLVQEGDTLWEIAKRFHTTPESIVEGNGLNSDEVRAGDCLILVKEIDRQAVTTAGRSS